MRVDARDIIIIILSLVVMSQAWCLMESNKNLRITKKERVKMSRIILQQGDKDFKANGYREDGWINE